MLALDTTFLVDYLDGVEVTREFLDERSECPFFASAMVLFEVYRGSARVDGRDGFERAAAAVDWVEPLPTTDAAAREAALVETELLDAGMPINLGDALTAGVCRHHGAAIVTRDGHFDRVDGLEVVEY